MSISFLSYTLIGFGLATAFVGGVFLSYSDFIMRSLAVASPTSGSEAMQMINREVFRSVFMVLFMGLVPASLALTGYAHFTLDGTTRNIINFASVIYIFGVFLVTGLGNVPMNNKLDAMTVGGAEALSYWPRYIERWTSLNSIRTAASLVAAAAFMSAALHLAAS